MSADDRPLARARFSLRLGMRWKLLIAFGVGFTIIFLGLAWLVLRFATETATDRLTSNLRAISEGAAQIIDADRFEQVIALDTAPATGDQYPADAGTLSGTTVGADSIYPAAAVYWAHNNEVADIRRTNPEASPYTYYADADGVLRFVGSWGAFGYPTMGVDQPAGGLLQQPVTDIVPEVTARYLRAGLQSTTFQPAYRDTISRWISVYTPIRNSAGKVIGGMGVDYDMSYVDRVRSNATRVLYPVLGATYLVLMLLVFLLSTWLTRRLGRLSIATTRVADGDYQVDLSTATKSVFPDEMTELARSFSTMAGKVEQRERTLAQQVKVLKVEIDETKRRQAVVEITESDFFADLTAKAGAMRAKVKADDPTE